METRLVVMVVPGAEDEVTGSYSKFPWVRNHPFSFEGSGKSVCLSYREAEPLQVFLREHINRVGDVGPQESLPAHHHNQLSKPLMTTEEHTLGYRTHLELIPKHVLGVRAPRVVRRGRDGGGRVPKHPRPLLDGLVVVLHIKRLVGAAVVDLHPGPRPGIPRVHVLDNVGPLLLGPDGLARRARRVPKVRDVVGAHEAARGDARVGDTRCEDVRVCCGQDVL